ncbi:MAG: hypothetical protein V4793_39070 [Paraburkholderia tropica]
MKQSGQRRGDFALHPTQQALMMTRSQHDKIRRPLRNRLAERIHEMAAHFAKVDELAVDFCTAALQPGLRGLDRGVRVTQQFDPESL